MDMDIVYLILTLGVPFFVWAREWNITERAHARESLYIKFPHHLLKFYRSHYIKIVITIISTQSTWCIKLRQHNKEAYQHCTWHEKKKIYLREINCRTRQFIKSLLCWWRNMLQVWWVYSNRVKTVVGKRMMINYFTILIIRSQILYLF